jgi:hypothetical protein
VLIARYVPIAVVIRRALGELLLHHLLRLEHDALRLAHEELELDIEMLRLQSPHIVSSYYAMCLGRAYPHPSD